MACGDPSFKPCSNPRGLPANFCCPASTTCIAFNSNNSIICCPSGDCGRIAPVSCDVRQQDASQHAQAAIKTKNLKVKLQTCGQGCCPQGYECQNSACSLVKKSSASASSSSASSSKSASKSSSTSSAPSTTVSLPNPTSEASSSSSPATIAPLPAASNSAAAVSATPQVNKFPAPAVLLGLFLGIALGALLAALGIYLWWSRRRRRTISSPIQQQQYLNRSPVRTDFLGLNMGRSNAGQNTQSMASRGAPHLGNRDSNVTSIYPGNRDSNSTASMHFMLDETPPRSTHANQNRTTAFTDLMERGGFKREEGLKY